MKFNFHDWDGIAKNRLPLGQLKFFFSFLCDFKFSFYDRKKKFHSSLVANADLVVEKKYESCLCMEKAEFMLHIKILCVFLI